ncbi:MAG: DUF5777 family beta-barrel protein [Vicinamibacterales bacterium]
MITLGAIIGFEYRFAPAANLQIGAHRSLLFKTIQIFARHDTIRRSDRMPVGVSGHEDHDHDVPGTSDADHSVEEERMFYAGLGGRLRLRPTVFIVGEIIPRTGFTPGAHQWAAGIEKRTDGHQFQLNVSNSFGTTNAQLARGGTPGNVYLGFNLARKF